VTEADVVLWLQSHPAEARALLMRFLLGYATGELRACGVSEEVHICFGAALLAFPKPLERPS
jgi:hypothetical protein